MKSKAVIVLALGALMLAAGCKGETAKQESVDLENDESILIDTDESILDDNDERIFRDNDDMESGSDFSRTDITSRDNFTLTSVVHNSHASSGFYRLRMPNGNLCLVASGAQEACQLTGYRIDYDDDGSVKSVNFIDALDDEEYRKLNGSSEDVEVMKRWVKASQSHDYGDFSFKIVRDEEGKVKKVGAIEVPYGFSAKYYLAQWGPFWTNDIVGGCIGFFVELIDDNIEGSSVNYLYFDNHLIAEKAYWKGTFIKARTYNHMGCMVEKYTDRNINLLEQTFYDFSETPMWYVDKE